MLALFIIVIDLGLRIAEESQWGFDKPAAALESYHQQGESRELVLNHVT